MKDLKKIELNKKNKCGLALQHAKKSYNHRTKGDYNAKFFYSPLRIILNAFNARLRLLQGR